MKNWIDFVKTNDPTMVKQGYLWLPRTIANEIFTEDAISCYQARIFAALLIKANYSKGYTVFKNRKVSCNTGELIIDINELAIQTDIPSYRVHRILDELKNNELIEMIYRFRGRFIEINNYKRLTSPFTDKSLTDLSNRPVPSLRPINCVPDSHKKQLEENRRIMEEVRKHK